MIYKSDGTPYKLTGSLQQFDDESLQRDLFNDWDQEAIKQGGSPIFYCEMFVQNQTVDPIYLEDRGKLFSNNPVQLYGTYEPIASQNMQTAFGIDAPDEMMFEFNYKAVMETIGYLPHIGSQLDSPFLREKWVIIQRKLAEFKMWNVIRLQILCQRYQENTTDKSGVATQKKTDYKII